ncbi:MAG: hypothetical protein J6M43_09350 [Neisseriaceae bacterium]|nr:hypothetical protein [Neisseriaceae bacterium]
MGSFWFVRDEIRMAYFTTTNCYVNMFFRLPENLNPHCDKTLIINEFCNTKRIA